MMTVWFDKWRYDDAEANFYGQKTELTKGICGSKDNSKLQESLNCERLTEASPAAAAQQQEQLLPVEAPGLVQQRDPSPGPQPAVQTAPVLDVVQQQDEGCAMVGGASPDVMNRVTKLEMENAALNKSVKKLEDTLSTLTQRLAKLECTCNKSGGAPAPSKPEPMAVDEDDDDDDVDLFGSDDEEEDAAAAKVRADRLKAYADKKSKKVGPIAKSSVLLECKPWDNETDVKEMEAAVRGITMDGLVWAASKFITIAYGIQKLSILCVVEDEKVSIDDLCEKIEALEDYIQSVDVQAFNKI